MVGGGGRGAGAGPGGPSALPRGTVYDTNPRASRMCVYSPTLLAPGSIQTQAWTLTRARTQKRTRTGTPTTTPPGRRMPTRGGGGCSGAARSPGRQRRAQCTTRGHPLRCLDGAPPAPPKQSAAPITFHHHHHTTTTTPPLEHVQTGAGVRLSGRALRLRVLCWASAPPPQLAERPELGAATADPHPLRGERHPHHGAVAGVLHVPPLPHTTHTHTHTPGSYHE